MLTLVQNDPEVPAGSLLDLFEDNSVPYKVVCPFNHDPLPSLAGVSALIILGGAMGVHDIDTYPYLQEVKTCILDAAQLRIPLLGICLGGQLLAESLGASVHSQKNGELGIHAVCVADHAGTDPLFLGIPNEFTAFQWHYDCFDIPAGAVCLASSPRCAHQAFRYGSNQYGLQFHPEVTREIVSTWAEHLNCVQDTDRIIDDFVRSADAYNAVSRKLMVNFLRLAGIVS